MFLPFLFGERCPGWNDEREGGFVRILPRHKLPDLYLAVQEGILFNLYHCYRILSEVNGCPTHIRFSGGILHSEQWTQMCADIFQRELEVNRNEHGSLLGGAVLAMELLGVIDDACTYQPRGEPHHPARPREGGVLSEKVPEVSGVLSKGKLRKEREPHEAV